MRTAFIVLVVLMAASPSHASKSCMTMGEARAQFATSHLYWHGTNHCWDATPPRHRIVRRVKPKEEEQQAQPQEEQPAPPATREPKWRNAMSEMLPVDTPVVASSAPQLGALMAPGLNWLERWVDVAQVAPPSLLRRGAQAAAAEVSPSIVQKADPTVTPVRLILVFLSIVVILAVIELLFRNTIHDRLD